MKGNVGVAMVMVAVVTGCGAATPGEAQQQSTVVTAQQAASSVAPLLLSEYVEGSGHNKAVELVNPLHGDVDLAGYQLRLWSNGASAPTAVLALEGTLGGEHTLVVCHPQADAALLGRCDLTDERVAAFNGNDALELVYVGTTVRVLDTFGDVQPQAPFWGSGRTRTQDATLRRGCDVVDGAHRFPSRFDPALEWEAAAEDDFSNVGLWHCRS